MEQDAPKTTPKYEVKPKQSDNFKAKPYELLKINKQDFVDKFARKIGHLNRKLMHKSMCEAYAQAITDMQYFFMAVEKDQRSEEA